MPKLRLALSLAAVLCLVPAPASADCGHDHGAHPGGMADACPLEVPGTTVTVADTDDGVALVFTTSGGDVADLRQRVQKMAEFHNSHHAPGAAADPAGKAVGKPVPATARAEDVDGGARIVLTPTESSQLEALREHVREHAQKMASGDCPMKKMHGAAGHDAGHR